MRRSQSPWESLCDNQSEHSQMENAKNKVRLNSNQRAIQSLANVYWNPISAHASILIRGLKF